LGLGAILLVAIALGTDAFSLAVGIGMNRVRLKQIIVIASVVMVFHIVMPLIGLTLGSLLGELLGHLATVIGGGVLVVIGLQMAKESLKSHTQVFRFQHARKALPGRVRIRDSRFQMSITGVLLLAASVSLDALSVGFGLGTWRVSIPLTVLAMGVVAGSMTAAGLVFGRQLAAWVGERAETLGGAVLFIIGIKMLIT